MDIKTLSQLEDEFIGKRGTPLRDEYEMELSDLRIGAQLKSARLKLDLTQEQVAERVGKKRAFISRVENDGSNLTLRTLRDIIVRGLGGKLQLQVQV